MAADEDGVARLVLERGPKVRACLEMMSGAVWVRDRLAAVGRQVEIADARKVKTIARSPARQTGSTPGCASSSRRSGSPRSRSALRERLKRRLRLVRLRTSAKNSIFGLLTQWGLRISLERLRQADGLGLLEARGVPEVWRRSVSEALAVIDLLGERIAPLDRELGRPPGPTGASSAEDDPRHRPVLG